MTSAQLYRLSGLTLLIGVVLSLISTVVDGALFPNNDPSGAANPLNVVLSSIGVIGAVLVLLGLPGLYARSAREGGVMWLSGVVLIAITAMLFGVFFGLLGAVIFPALAVQAPDLLRAGPPPSFMVLFVVGGVANLLGALLMGIPILTQRLYPRWCAYLMFLEAIFAVLGFVLNGPGDTGVLGTILNVISPVPLFVVLGYAGYVMWSSAREAAEPSPMPAAQPA